MRVLLRPRWIIGHLLIIFMSVLMLSLANWQHHRLEDRRETNREIKAAMGLPVVEVSSLDVSGPQYSKVKVTGTWNPAHTVYRRYPIVNGVQGYEVLEPLVVEGGEILVNRGFVSLDDGQHKALPEFGAQNVVTVEGILRDGQHAVADIRHNDGNPPIPTITQVDLDAIGSLYGNVKLAPKWVQLSAPASPDGPKPLDPPEISEGPHFSYMLQWIGFTITIIVGWIVLCSRVVRRPND